MSGLQFPCTIYQTQHRFNDHSSDDMRYGDLTERELRQHYGLDDVSDVVNPWTGQDVSIFNAFSQLPAKSVPEMATLLFNEFLRLSMPFCYFGQRKLFTDLVKHFYRGRGNTFSSPFLDEAYRDLIISGQYNEKSPVFIIQHFLKRYINYENKKLSEENINVLTESLSDSRLPKFNRWIDCINGLGVSVHDVYATKIQILSLEITEDSYCAKVVFSSQDHFGLDSIDIKKEKFHHIRIFRIWFVLQRWEKFGFKPFFTYMTAQLEITGRI